MVMNIRSFPLIPLPFSSTTALELHSRLISVSGNPRANRAQGGNGIECVKKALLSRSQGISVWNACSVAAVVLTVAAALTGGPQQWLSAMYSPRWPGVEMCRRGGWVDEPTSTTRVGSWGERSTGQAVWVARQSLIQVRTRSKHASEEESRETSSEGPAHGYAVGLSVGYG